MAKLNMPDNVYNWIIDFLEGHSHQTNFGGQKSQFLKISASIIQGSGLGPATYSVVASDLRPLFPGNRLFKFADDTYLVIPASNVNSRCLELKHVQDWATANNLQLNTKKSQEMVCTKPRGRNSSKVVVPAIPDVERVTSLKMLGVIISHNFSMDEHVSAVISSSGHASTIRPSHTQIARNEQYLPAGCISIHGRLSAHICMPSMAWIRESGSSGQIRQFPEEKY